MKQWIELIHFGYPGIPKWKWTIHNDMGGSFSNSGEYRTIRELVKAFQAQYPDSKWLECSVRLIYQDIDSNGNCVQTTYDSYFHKLSGAK